MNTPAEPIRFRGSTLKNETHVWLTHLLREDTNVALKTVNPDRLCATVKAVEEMQRRLHRRTLRFLEAEACIQLNLTPRADSREYSTDVARELSRRVVVDSVSISSQRERTLRITRNCKIRMIEQIVDFRSNCDVHAFPQFEDFLYRKIKLREGGPPQNIATSSAELTRKW